MLSPTMYPESSFYLTHHKHFTQRTTLFFCKLCVFSFSDTTHLWFSSFLLILFLFNLFCRFLFFFYRHFTFHVHQDSVLGRPLLCICSHLHDEIISGVMALSTTVMLMTPSRPSPLKSPGIHPVCTLLPKFRCMSNFLLDIATWMSDGHPTVICAQN